MRREPPLAQCDYGDLPAGAICALATLPSRIRWQVQLCQDPSPKISEMRYLAWFVVDRGLGPKARTAWKEPKLDQSQDAQFCELVSLSCKIERPTPAGKALAITQKHFHQASCLKLPDGTLNFDIILTVVCLDNLRDQVLGSNYRSCVDSDRISATLGLAADRH